MEVSRSPVKATQRQFHKTSSSRHLRIMHCPMHAFIPENLRSERSRVKATHGRSARSLPRRHEHRKEESISIATSMLDARVGSLKDLFGRRNNPMRAPSSTAKRSFTGNRPRRTHPFRKEAFRTIYSSTAGKSIISKETQRGSLWSRKPRNAGFRA